MKHISLIIILILNFSLSGCSIFNTSGKDFYVHGKIVDQNDKPVAGAIIQYSIVYYGAGVMDILPIWDATVESNKIVSEKDGTFNLGEILNIKKFSIINIKKSGYEYKNYQPTSNFLSLPPYKQMLIHLWKK